MDTHYSSMPAGAERLGTRYSHLLNDSYICSEAEEKRTSLATNFVVAVALAFGCNSASAENNWHKLPESNVVWIESLNDVESSSGEETVDAVEAESPVVLSKEIQAKFGFKTAQWAAVLNVERKTLYNWQKNPETSVQKRVAERINVFADFAQEIAAEHLRYIPKLAFGRYLDKQFSEHLQASPLELDDLVDDYYRLYSELDGFFKRDKHSRAMS